VTALGCMLKAHSGAVRLMHCTCIKMCSYTAPDHLPDHAEALRWSEVLHHCRCEQAAEQRPALQPPAGKESTSGGPHAAYAVHARNHTLADCSDGGSHSMMSEKRPGWPSTASWAMYCNRK
jgi:hypothetical protein